MTRIPPPRNDPKKRRDFLNNPDLKRFRDIKNTSNNKNISDQKASTHSQMNINVTNQTGGNLPTQTFATTSRNTPYVESEMQLASTSAAAAASARTSVSDHFDVDSDIQQLESVYNYDIYENKQILYPEHHPGPYYVLVTSEEPITSRRMNSELHLFVKFKKADISGNFETKNIAFKTFRLTFNNPISANDFVNNKKLPNAGLKAFIPASFAQKYYIVKHVPEEFTGQEIIESINNSGNDFEAISVVRFKTKNERGKTVFSQTIKVGLIADTLVTKIKMFRTNAHADLYVPAVRLCKNCGRLGHIAIRCRSKKRCLSCGRNIICPNDCATKRCDSCLATTKCTTVCVSPRCILCNQTDHSAIDSSVCQKYSNEKKLNGL